MCEYCGCQQIAVIKELTREHEAVVSAIGEVRRALDAGSVGAAAQACRRMTVLLGPHTVVEEEGLFPFMAPDYPAHVDALRAEHRSIDAVLREASDGTPEDPTWPDRLLRALHDLREHILKEQDGVFPAALGVLDSEEWEGIEGIRARVGSGLTARPEQHDHSDEHDHEHEHGRAADADADAPSGRTPR